MSHDPSAVVRRTVVRVIGATRLTLPHVIKRTKDSDESVRKAAFKFIAEKVWRDLLIYLKSHLS